MKRLLLLFLLLTGCGAPPPHDDFLDVEAAKMASRWLTEIDRGLAEKAWLETAPVFQKLAPEGAKQLARSRRRTGLLISRREKRKQLSQGLPGLPPGTYLMVEYDTRFAHDRFTETAILTQEGGWKIVGYFMRKAMDPRP